MTTETDETVCPESDCDWKVKDPEYHSPNGLKMLLELHKQVRHDEPNQ